MGAFAATKNTVIGGVPNISSTTAPLTTVSLSTIRIDEDVVGNMKAGDTLVLTLPSGVEWGNLIAGPAPDAVIAFDVDGDTFAIASQTIPSARVMNVVLGARAAGAGPAVMTITTPVFIKSVGTGDIVVNIESPGTGITEGDMVIGRFVSGAASVRMLSTPTKSEGSQNFGLIRITENSIGQLNGKTIRMKLPSGFKWTASPAISFSNIGTTTIADGGAVYPTNDITLTFTVPAGPQAIIDLTAPITVESGARVGDIEVLFSGTADVSGSIVVGKYGEFGVNVTVAAAEEVISGKDSQEIADLKIKDQIAGSLINGRTFRMTLPENTRWSAVPTVTGISGNLVAGALSNDNRTVTYTVAAAGTTEFDIKNANIDVAANYSGDINVEITGTAGASGKFLVAKAVKQVSAQTSPVDLKIGRQEQVIGDIYVVEGAKEALRASSSLAAIDRTLTLRLPAGFSWSAATVEVVEGNVGVDSWIHDFRRLDIVLSGESTTPSKIKVTGAKVSADRTVPEGDVNVAVQGGAVMQNAVAFTNVTNMGTYSVATVVTPAADGTVKPVVMTVGSTVYTISGVEMTMDVAPYIKDTRTYFPVRYVAQALGITADNVVWDGAQRTVTIFRANRIVQVTIGSTTMLVNGVPLTMDAAPEITAERTMLPIRFVAQGLGVNVNWDAATQTVTLN